MHRSPRRRAPRVPRPAPSVTTQLASINDHLGDAENRPSPDHFSAFVATVLEPLRCDRMTLDEAPPGWRKALSRLREGSGLAHDESEQFLDTWTRYWFLLMPVTLLGICFSFGILRSRVGHAFKALREDPIAAAAAGVNVRRYELRAFVSFPAPAPRTETRTLRTTSHRRPRWQCPAPPHGLVSLRPRLPPQQWGYSPTRAPRTFFSIGKIEMSQRDAFEQILTSLHAVALGHADWSCASLAIDEALGTHGSTLSCGDGDSENFRLYSMWTCLRGHRRRELERLYLETYYPVDEGIPRLRRRPFNELIHFRDLYTEEELRSSEAYHALRTFVLAGNGVYVRLQGLDGSRIAWQICDPVDGRDWSSAQLATIRNLMPHIRHFQHVHRAMGGSGALGTTLTDLLDATGLGIIQLDARGRIVHANDRSRDLLRAGHALFDKKGSLLARTSQGNAELQRLLSRALPPSGARGTGGSMILKRAHGLPPLILHVHPVSQQETYFAVWPIAALVLVVDPLCATAVDPTVAGAALGLTPMESRVAVLMANGVSVPRIAAAMDRKISTIRSHVKRTYAKLGLTRQVELVRLVQSLGGARHPHR